MRRFTSLIFRVSERRSGSPFAWKRFRLNSNQENAVRYDIRKFVHVFHRWLGLLLGLQVVLWMASGVIMSWFHIDLVRGETTSKAPFALELAPIGYASPGGVIAQMEGVREVRLKTWLHRRVYEVHSFDGVALFDANNGDLISPITEDDARNVAMADYLGEASLSALHLMDDPPIEYRGATPVWRADFDDQNQTRLYISQDTGAVIARRNRVRRIYDFFWMLHIMDYPNREDFNNPLIRAASATGLLFALSGLFLVVIRLRAGRYLRGRNSVE